MNEPIAAKRTIETKAKSGLTVQDILLIGILLAAGAVLKFFVGSVINFGMKPNFIIAMYCLILMLIKPKISHAAVIGLLAGAVCQFFPGTPYINIASELIGAVSMALLLHIPMQIKKFSLQPIVCTFFSTLISGFAYIGVMYLAFYSGAAVTPTPLAAFLAIIFGTAAINAVIVQVLYLPLKLALKK